MPSRLRDSQGRFRAEDEADFVGPLRVMVGAGLLYILWTAMRSRSDSAAAALPVAPSTPSKGS